MTNTIDTFFDRLRVEGECVVYDGPRTPKGYGMFGINGESWRAHRFSYFYFVDEIGDSHVLHRCDNPPCVLPAHLWLGTNEDNVADKTAKGRAGKPKTTHCIRGHERNETNMRIDSKGRRHCRPCQNISQKKRRQTLDKTEE